MSANSSIEWTNHTWNPIRARNIATGKVGWHCEHATTGCEFCYAEGFNKRLGTGLPFKPGHRKDIEIFLDEDMLTLPLRWKKPRKIFVCSMTDLFADFVLDEWIDKMFAVMALCPQHTFQVLTKRAERMRKYLAQFDQRGRYVCSSTREQVWNDPRDGNRFLLLVESQDWPLPTVWLGVSCERQEEADARIPLLLQTPAAVRFISAEPLLGPIDLEAMPFPDGDTRHRWSALTGQALMYATGVNGNPDLTVRMEKPLRNKLDWVIAGGESGSQARPMHPQWARDLRDQCQAAGVPYFFKQWGGWIPDHFRDDPRQSFQHNQWFTRVGKKAAGRLLDGREWNEFPQIRQKIGEAA